MGVRTYDTGPDTGGSWTPGPGTVPTLAVGGLATLLLLANGRPVGESPVAGVSGAILAVFQRAAGLVIEMDPVGVGVLGKLLAAACGGVAAAALFSAVARRHPVADARTSGLLLAVGTTLAAASQAWSCEAPAAAAVAVAVLLLSRAAVDGDPALAARAAAPLALAVVVCPSTWALALALLSGVLLRWWRSGPALLVWLTPAALVALSGLFLSGGVPEPASGGLPALLLSPARGVVVFAPILLVGLAGVVRAVRPPRARRHWDTVGPQIWLPLTATAAVAAHLFAVTLDGGWASGPFWGPRLLAPAAPLLLVFLPEGLSLLRGAGAALAAVSVAVQLIGAFAYDGRWDRLHGGQAGVTWDPRRSPIVFQVRERVVRPSLLALSGGRVLVREHPLVVGGPRGSRVTFGDTGVQVDGADATVGDVLLEGGARVSDGRLLLSGPDDALFFRVRAAARGRALQLRVTGQGPGTLGVGEQTFWTAPQWTTQSVEGSFRVRVPWTYAESGGGDIRLVSREGGSLEITSVALVPPGEPDNVIRLR